MEDIPEHIGLGKHIRKLKCASCTPKKLWLVHVDDDDYSSSYYCKKCGKEACDVHRHNYLECCHSWYCNECINSISTFCGVCNYKICENHVNMCGACKWKQICSLKN